MESRLQSRDITLTSPQQVRDYLRLRIADREHEVFVALFLDRQARWRCRRSTQRPSSTLRRHKHRSNLGAKAHRDARRHRSSDQQKAWAREANSS
jgi:hypothetical protein